jgi:hypothetical protein
MKYTAGPRILFYRHLLVLLTGMALVVGGCGGPDSMEIDPDVPSLSKKTISAEPPTPPGGMELPSKFRNGDFPNNDRAAANAEAGTSFELPE